MSAPQPPAEEPSEADLDMSRKVHRQEVFRFPHHGAEMIAAYRAKCVAEALREANVTIGLLKSNLFDEGANFSNLVKDYEELGDTLTVTREERDKAEKALSGRDALIVQMRDALEDCLEKLDGYANRQGRVRMGAREMGPDGNKHQSFINPNPHEGQHYPSVQSCVSKARSALSLAKAKISELEKAK